MAVVVVVMMDVQVTMVNAITMIVIIMVVEMVTY